MNKMEKEFIENYEGYDIYKHPNGYFIAETQLSPIAKNVEELKKKIDRSERLREGITWEDARIMAKNAIPLQTPYYGKKYDCLRDIYMSPMPKTKEVDIIVKTQIGESIYLLSAIVGGSFGAAIAFIVLKLFSII